MTTAKAGWVAGNPGTWIVSKAPPRTKSLPIETSAASARKAKSSSINGSPEVGVVLPNLAEGSGGGRDIFRVTVQT